jgi:hypothetical protein
MVEVRRQRRPDDADDDATTMIVGAWVDGIAGGGVDHDAFVSFRWQYNVVSFGSWRHVSFVDTGVVVIARSIVSATTVPSRAMHQWVFRFVLRVDRFLHHLQHFLHHFLLHRDEYGEDEDEEDADEDYDADDADDRLEPSWVDRPAFDRKDSSRRRKEEMR